MIVTVQSIYYVSMFGASAGFHKQAKEINMAVVALGSKLLYLSLQMCGLLHRL